MAMTAEETVRVEALIKSDPVLSNAFRLMEDASILFDNQRYAGCVALASLGTEEVGKYLLSTWTQGDPGFRYDKKRLHVMKHCVIAALFMTEAARANHREAGFDFKTATPEDFARLATLTLDGMKREAEFATLAKEKVLEYVKWSGMYYDDTQASKGISPANITGDNARSAMEMLSKAFICIARNGNVDIAQHAFSVSIQRNSQRKCEETDVRSLMVEVFVRPPRLQRTTGKQQRRQSEESLQCKLVQALCTMDLAAGPNPNLRGATGHEVARIATERAQNPRERRAFTGAEALRKV
jgi:AbiV family abortive infection protein